ncbi:MAG TPA: TetR/AcrR family transcriptional regulator [Aeromicrobium sp.]|nr:TetR/AcrR family transcriptional regulator [Aeromicrobium sp.]
MSQTDVDGRRARGDVTRRTVARAAARAATIEGLDSITVGGLAAVTGVSKSGILTVFGTREAIQIAAVAEARRLYQEWVVSPAWDRPAGVERLTALIENWVAYTKADVFPGGCFVAATSVEFGHRDGPVAESVQRLKREWLDLLEAELKSAGSTTPADDAFRIDSYLCMGNTRWQLYGDRSEVDRAGRLALEIIDTYAG